MAFEGFTFTDQILSPLASLAGLAGLVAQTGRSFKEVRDLPKTFVPPAAKFIHIPSVLNRYTYGRGVPRSARQAIRSRRNLRKRFRKYRRYY